MAYNALLSSTFAAQREGQAQRDRRTQRNAIGLFLRDEPTPTEQNTNALGASSASPAGPPVLSPEPAITGNELPPALPAGSPAVATPAATTPVATSAVGVPALAPPPSAEGQNVLAPRRPNNRRAALATLAGIGDFETASRLSEFDDRRRSDDTRDRIAPMVRSGEYGEAAREAGASGQVDLARSLFAMSADDLQATKHRGQQGASAIYAALALPPEQRAGYMAQHQRIAADAGITPDQFAAFDWSNDGALRAVADRWLEASKLAGDVSLQRFGDNVQTVRTGVSGSEVLDSREVPVTRAEQLDRTRVNYAQETDRRDFDYKREQDRIDNDYRTSRAEAEDTYRRWQMENPNSRGDVEGQILNKAVRDGVESLRPEERAIYDRYLESGQQAGGFGMGATPPPAGAAVPTAPARAPSGGGASGTRENPARPSTPQEAATLPSGAFFLDPSGSVRQRP